MYNKLCVEYSIVSNCHRFDKEEKIERIRKATATKSIFARFYKNSPLFAMMYVTFIINIDKQTFAEEEKNSTKNVCCSRQSVRVWFLAQANGKLVLWFGDSHSIISTDAKLVSHC